MERLRSRCKKGAEEISSRIEMDNTSNTCLYGADKACSERINL